MTKLRYGASLKVLLVTVSRWELSSLYLAAVCQYSLQKDDNFFEIEQHWIATFHWHKGNIMIWNLPNDNVYNIVCNSCWFHKMTPEKALRLYFLAPSVLFFSLIWLPWHFLHRVVEIGFLLPHLKHILKYSLRCCAICFFAASVIGILLFLLQERALFYLSISILFCKDIHYYWIFFVVPFWLCKKWIQSTQNMTNIRDGKIIDQRIMMGPYILAPR